MVELDGDGGWRGDALRTSIPPTSLRRDQRFDLLRGWCVAALVIDHIAGWSPLFLLTGGGEFYVTAAEGFVCISGFLVGAVYGRLAEERGARAVWRRALVRALLLYALMVGTTMIVVLEGTLASLPFWHPVSSVKEYFEFIGRVATFRYWLHHTRILGTYSLLLLLVPGVIRLLKRGSTALLLGISWAVYLAYQASPRHLSWPFPVEAGFHPYAYQLLFVHCAALGYHRHRVRQLFARWERPFLWLSGFGLAALVALFVWETYAHPSETAALWLGRLFQRDYLRPGRVVGTVFAAALSFAAVTRYASALDRTVAPVLTTLGRRALFTYAIHLPIVVFFDWWSKHWQGWGWTSIALNVVAQAAVLAAVWSLARARDVRALRFGFS